MPVHSKTLIFNLAARGLIIMIIAMTASVAIVSWISSDLPPDLYHRSIVAALLIPMLISPPISLWVGWLNYRHFKLHRKVEWLADHDEMTGLLNRRALQAAAANMRDQPSNSRMAQPLLLLLADIDHFKTVNDNLGHDAGDEAIRHVSNILMELSPEGAAVARLGGDEFAILTDWTSLADTRSLAASICSTVEQLPCVYQGHLIPLTVSLGVAIGSRTEKIDFILRRADEQLYSCKREGRNSYAIAPNVAA